MSEAERRTGYADRRVLITAARILDPQFGAQSITLDGAQVELLRNVVEYLWRDTTFVDRYETGYYIKAAAEDFDAISAIVADLEGKLANNDNTIFGYNDRLLGRFDDTTDGADPFYVGAGQVPAGEVWEVEQFTLYQNEGSPVSVHLSVHYSAQQYPALGELTVPNGTWYGGALNLLLAEGEELKAAFHAMSASKAARLVVIGYKMKVPE